MVSPVKEVSSSHSSSGGADETVLAELRASVNALAKEVAAVAEQRARAAAETVVNAADTGATELRRGIRRQPVLAMAIAAGVGALIAVAVVPRRVHHRSAWDRLPSFDRWTPNVTRADLYDLADNIQRSVSRAASAAAAPVTPAFERMVDVFSRADTSTLNNLAEKFGGWFQKAQEKAKEKVR